MHKYPVVMVVLLVMLPWLCHAYPAIWLRLPYGISIICVWLSLWLWCHNMPMIMMMRILSHPICLSYDTSIMWPWVSLCVWCHGYDMRIISYGYGYPVVYLPYEYGYPYGYYAVMVMLPWLCVCWWWCVSYPMIYGYPMINGPMLMIILMAMRPWLWYACHILWLSNICI